MGVVYRAHDTKLDRDVALKFLPPYQASDTVEKERFFHEARAASALNHPNVTTIHEIDEYNGQVFITMEMVEGKTLKQLVKTEALSVKKALEIAIQICDGLAAAAEKGIVHRDIKSDNIIQTSKGQVKIMDFGLAKIKGASKLTKTGSTVGTAAYMSPEQASGEEVDHRSDIFSFGVVLYELLTGKLPFKGDHPASLAYAIINDEPQPLARFNDKVSAELQRIVVKALAKDREERYQSVNDMGADLRRERKNWEYAKSTTVPKAEAAPRPKRGLLKVLIPTSAVALLAFLFFLFNPFKVEVSHNQTAAASQNALAVMYFENIPDPEDKDHTGEMLTNLLITALSQASGLEVVSRQRLYDIQEEMGKADAKKITPSLASKIAQRAGVRTMLLGTVLQSQPKLAITSQLIDVSTGKILSSHRLSGYSADQMFSMVDSLALLVRNGLNVSSSPAAEAKSVAEATTNSPEAYRSYLEGIELNKKFYTAEAKAAFNRAIELDSNFAMAYFQLSNLSLDLSDNLTRNGALRKAWQLRDNVAENERLRIEAAYANRIDNNLAKSAELLEKLLQKYPHEQDAYGGLASAYENLQAYEKSLKTRLRAVESDSLDKTSWNSLAYRYAWFNQRKPAFEAIDRYLKLAPAEPNPYDSKGDLYYIFGELDSALYWYQKAVSFRMDFASIEKLGNLALLRGDYAGAQADFRQFGSTPDKFQKAAAEADLLLIPLHQGKLKQLEKQLQDKLALDLAQKFRQEIINDYAALRMTALETGDYAAALKYAQKASAEAKKDPNNKYYGRGGLALAWLKAGNPQTAYKILDEFKRDVVGKVSLGELNYNLAAGFLEYERGNYAAAVEKFEKAVNNLWPNRAPLYEHAVSLLKTGRLEEAVSELKRLCWWVIDTDNFNLSSRPWALTSVKAHYWLGVAYEQQGNKAQAREEYEKFLEIWKEADFNSPELADAKIRLAKLKQTASK